MINTYQTSLAPPPVPPRLGRSHPVLIPTPLPSQGHSKSLIRFLVVASHSSERQETPSRPLARMVVEQQPHALGPDYLQWDMTHSLRKGINYYHSSWLTILQPGDYYVYSRVTFSKGDPQNPLASKVKLRKNETGEEKTVMKSYCSMDSHSGSALIPRMCTASQGEVITLEKGNQLSLWVQDRSLVNYEDGATTFGMYKL
ncbi:Tumor necrosis factor ligand superfamily member 6 CD95 ligand [Collichthys lucidus]|uniref:Tumor necrosis factor ligand superfamily member 6 CD95 ligand n=1 Tax=Collichthys lucidus TaxID=240159 RepID=A0A4U5UCU8_COLLU|nr:Tumor necrosis factor ligand superfamily member 6 CD95 ligand [Collichthys lucidus]